MRTKRPRHRLIEINYVTKGDIDAIQEVANACNLAPWTASDYLSELLRSDSLFLKASAKDKPCRGFILGRFMPAVNAKSGVDAEIYNVGVIPDEQHLGIGSKLIQSFFKECRNRCVSFVWLEVRQGNLSAISFYSRHKFEVVAVRRSFYRDPVEDAIVMRSNLYESLQTDA